MKRAIATLMCIVVLACMVGGTVLSAAADGQPAGDDIFFNAPGGNEYQNDLPTIDIEPEDGLSEGTIALISMAAIFFACCLGGFLYSYFKKRKK